MLNELLSLLWVMFYVFFWLSWNLVWLVVVAGALLVGLVFGPGKGLGSR